MSEPTTRTDELSKWRWPHIPLMFMAFLSTWAAGIPMAAETAEVAQFLALPDADTLLEALFYPVGVMAILFAHEMGHYLQAKRHEVETSPPYFIPGIPIPGVGMLPFIGTLGAFIRMELRPLKSKQLLEIGAWGPLAGWLLTVPCLFLGMAMSEVEPLPDGDLITLGPSVLLVAAESIFHPNIPAGSDIMLHPLGMAGWTGCLLTALNLLPVGQLDGGHIAYTTFGRGFNRVAPIVFGLLVLLGIFAFAGWIVFGFLVAVLGIRHPEIVVDGPVRGRDAWLGWASIVMLATTFAFAPIQGMSLLHVIGIW